MNLHEYQAKELLQQFGVAIPKGIKVTSQQEAIEAAKQVREGGPWVVKAQVHAGGRGKAGGVKFVRTIQDVEEVSGRLLGSTLVTKQTGAEGVKVHQLLIQDGVDIAKEYYLSCLVDRSKKRVILIGSSEGGMDIEEVAAKTPEKILTLTVDPAAGIQPYQARDLGFKMGMGKKEVDQLIKVVSGVYSLFVQKDCSMVEINPLIVTADGQVMALDAKVSLDDNALYRHKDTAEMRDPTQEDEREHIAHEIGLNYVALDGSIGCMVNGAGLAMATMDTIKYFGGDPANFLDVGGSSNPKKVVAAFKLILKDPAVKVILINIFGGITRCDDIAKGILEAMSQMDVPVPIVVRLKGTNEKEGLALLEGTKLTPAQTLEDGATIAAKLGG
ncbi:MAG: ADP-forming succinate--CoA ligase subunit beta, partial [Candidatus Competibacteraceae bacterium]|nr:ADP-forming succinate--CoA ligase subunit beta [Candidatus Competibacteraceae bacterium]